MTTYTTKPSPMHSGHDIRDERGHMVAIVHNPAANRAEGARIAALMAAAPELLSSIKDLLAIAIHRGDKLGIDSHGPVFREARAAIARATGAAQ